MKNRVICVVGAEEIEMLTLNVIPNCRDHRHISRLEANQMTGRGDFKPYFIPIAEWVGPKHIRMLNVSSLRGQTCKFHEYAVKAKRRKQPWALALFAQTRMQQEHDLSYGKHKI